MSPSRFRFETTCVDCRDVRKLNDMIDQARDITYRTFIRHVHFADLAEMFPIYNWRSGRKGGLRMKDDYAVSFFKSRYGGKLCYGVDWSCIEHVWVEFHP